MRNTRNKPPCRFELVASALAAIVLTSAPAWSDHGNEFAHSEQGISVHHHALPHLATDGYTIDVLHSDAGPVRALSGAGMPGLGAMLYVVQEEVGRIIAIELDGSQSLLANIQRPADAAPTVLPAVDVTGTFEAPFYIGIESDSICQVSLEGTIAPFDCAIDTSWPELSLAFDPMGSFGGGMVVTQPDGSLIAIDVEGQVSVLATGLSLVRHGLAFSPGGTLGEALFAVDPGASRILRVDASTAPGPAEIWADLSMGAEPIEPSSVAVSPGGAFGTDRLYVVDRVSGEVLVLDATGAIIDVLLTGIDANATLEFPTAGPLAGSLLVSNGTNALAIWPDLPSDLDGDGAVGATDLAILLGNWGICPEGGSACMADLTADGQVDATDLAILLSDWGS